MAGFRPRADTAELAAQQGVPMHDVNRGQPCLACDACPGFEYNVFAKRCKHCKCTREQHASAPVPEKEQVGQLQFVEEGVENFDETGYCYEYDEPMDEAVLQRPVTPPKRRRGSDDDPPAIMAHDAEDGYEMGYEDLKSLKAKQAAKSGKSAAPAPKPAAISEGAAPPRPPKSKSAPGDQPPPRPAKPGAAAPRLPQRGAAPGLVAPPISAAAGGAPRGEVVVKVTQNLGSMSLSSLAPAPPVPVEPQVAAQGHVGSTDPMAGRHASMVHPLLDRAGAEAILTARANAMGGAKAADGLFLVRTSQRVFGAIVISMVGGGRCYHYQFTRKNGSFLSDKGKALGSLDAVVAHYQANEDAMPTVLRQCVGRAD